MRSHVEKLVKSAEEAAFVGDLGEVYKIMKADSPVLDFNGNILSTDEEKLNRWRENTLSLCLIMLCRVIFLLLL